MVDKKLKPIRSVLLGGMTVSSVFFHETAGSDKMFIIFTNGAVLVMPVYRECPVQLGTIEELVGDFEEFKEKIEEEKRIFCEERDDLLDKLGEIANGLDSSKSG